MNFFDWLNKVFESDEPKGAERRPATTEVATTKRSAEEIYEINHKDPLKQQRVLSLNMMLMLTISLIEMAQKTQWPCPSAKKSSYEKYLELCRQGQRDSEYTQRQLALAGDYPELIKQAREAHQLLYFMRSVWQNFGTQTLIVKSDDFAKVCDKYKLVCGNLSDYSGEIPLTNKRELDDAKAIFKGYGKDKYNSNYVTSKFPANLTWEGSIWDIGKIEPHIRDNGWFIAAPKELFRNTIKAEYVAHRDPFVFTVSELGYILIHAKWGAEAEDATIKRYEQLRDAIVGKGAIV